MAFSFLNWLLILSIPLVIFIAVLVYRQSYKRKIEIKQQVVIAAIGLASAALVEYLGVSMDLWHYIGGDWPAILWIVYLISALATYQIVKLVIEKVR